MKVVILAGGFGSRLSEESDFRPKPLVEIGGKPIIWHIMKIYERAGFTDFVVCCGYLGSMIKNYFVNYFTQNYDIKVELGSNSIEFLGNPSERWTVQLIDTGLNTMTGGRLARIKPYVENEAFCLTYGDGLTDLDVSKVVEFHRSHGKLATVTSVPSKGRFGVLEFAGDSQTIARFYEKPQNEAGWINGGFFVLEPGIFQYLDGEDSTIWEGEPLEKLAGDGELVAYKHSGFWQPMDTLREKRELQAHWDAGNPPWMPKKS